ncbi:MAG: type II toxin-antitoxin system RelB/DinJ family antitoxin [Erysipelotrichaceae bacterium]|nr:type II toxin-antitoxin system RelB/DinJ family antitoxin [Erysipelotrichaceae bacterium]
MSQVMVNFRMDGDMKKKMELTCKKMGLTMTSAFTMFAAKVISEQRIPFEVTADPFYSKENRERILRSIEQLEKGLGVEHELPDEENLV